MFLPAMPMINDTSETESDPNMKTAIVELIQKSAKELVYNRGQYEQILLGEVKVVGSFISADKVLMLLLKTLREKKRNHDFKAKSPGYVSIGSEALRFHYDSI